jgi:hypothetical protein
MINEFFYSTCNPLAAMGEQQGVSKLETLRTTVSIVQFDKFVCFNANAACAFSSAVVDNWSYLLRCVSFE